MRLAISILCGIVMLTMGSCSKNSSGTVTVHKPRNHHSHYAKSVQKKHWHIGRITFRFEKQGVKKVKMKS
jgi:hypothetical protein